MPLLFPSAPDSSRISVMITTVSSRFAWRKSVICAAGDSDSDSDSDSDGDGDGGGGDGGGAGWPWPGSAAVDRGGWCGAAGSGLSAAGAGCQRAGRALSASCATVVVQVTETVGHG